MRLAFLILLLANAALFFWGQGYLGASTAGNEPGRVGRQKAPERLTILPADAAPFPVAPPRPALACKRIEWLDKDEAATLRDTLGALPDWQLAATPKAPETAHWVVVPALADRARAEHKKSELLQLGIKEGEIVEAGDLGPFAISFGVFRDPQRANELLQSLTKKGVRSARIGQRALPSEKVAIELRAPAATLDKKLPDLMTALPQATAQDCALP